MAIRLIRRSLAPAARADRVALPMPFGELGSATRGAARVVFEAGFIAADRQPIDDGVHIGDAAGDGDRMLGLLLRIDPAGELDDAVADGPDVHGALGEDRVV